MENSFENYDPSNEDNINSPYAEIHLPPGLEDKTVQQLRQNNLLLTYRWYQSNWMKAAAVIIIFAGGILLGRFSGSNQSTASGSLNEYLLLLYNPKNFIAGNAQHVKEYSAWLQNLRQEGNLADGEELMDNGWTIAMNNRKISTNIEPNQSSNGAVSGYFIIRTSSQEQALAIASSCPHLKYNGVIEVREIQHSGN